MRFIALATQAPAAGGAATKPWSADASVISRQSNMAGVYCGRFIKLAVHAAVRPEGLPGGVT